MAPSHDPRRLWFSIRGLRPGVDGRQVKDSLTLLGLAITPLLPFLGPSLGGLLCLFMLLERMRLRRECERTEVKCVVWAL